MTSGCRSAASELDCWSGSPRSRPRSGSATPSETTPASNPSAAPPTPTQVISLRPRDQNNTAGASIRLGTKGPDGNWPMAVTIRGLDQLGGGDYYALVLTKKGKPIVTCGTFNVSRQGATTIRMVAAYELKSFDGWAITQYDARTHRDWVVMTET